MTARSITGLAWPAGQVSAYALVLLSFTAGLANLLLIGTPGPVATFALVVIVSAWFGGTRPGVLAFGLSLASLGYFQWDPPDGVRTDVTRMVYFAVIGSFIVWVTGAQRRATESLRRAHDELQRQNLSLQRENTAGKALEELLRRSEDELRLVIDTMPTMAWITLPDGRVEFVNRRWLEYSGMTLEQALDSSNSAVHPDELPRVLAKWELAMAQATGFEDEMRLRGADGQYRWFLVNTVPLMGEDGRVVRWYGTSTDIEAFKRAEQAARRTEKELRDAFESIPAIAWTARPDGSNESTNRWWAAYTGLSAHDTEGLGWKLAVHPDDAGRFTGEWKAAVVRGGTFEAEARFRAADGTYRWHLVRGVPLRDAAGAITRWYGLNTDIEDRKQAEQRVRESAGRLQSLSRRLLEVQEEDRRHLARELHDEFGQILAAIKLHLHAARSTAGEAARPSLEESMSLLQRAGEQVRSLSLELRPAILDTAGLDGTLRWLARQHEQRTGVATEVVGSWSEPDADVEIACFRVVQEALTNVARHAGARHVSIELREEEESRHLTVEDDGIGFDVAWALEHGPGEGHLGLLGMRERVKILGGTLRIDSKAGAGARLRVELPSAGTAVAKERA